MKSWEAMWERGVGRGEFFDAAKTEPAFARLMANPSDNIRALLEGKGVPPRALVPGCGRGYALVTLAAAGFAADGLEIAPTAAKAAREYLASEGVERARTRVIEADFFSYSPEVAYALVFDSTFLCAIDPSKRQEWAAQMSRLVAEGGILVSNIFPIRPDGAPDPADGNVGSGPPFALSARLVSSLLEPAGFECIAMDPVPEELRARGAREVLAQFRRVGSGAATGPSSDP